MSQVPIVAFRVHRTWLGVLATQVVEITDRSEITRLPRAPSHVAGLTNVRGAAVPLLDLARFLELDDGRGPEDDVYAFPRIVVVDDGQTRVGVLADRVAGVQRVDEAELDGEARLLQNPRLREFIRGEIETPERILAILDDASLLKAAKVSE